VSVVNRANFTIFLLIGFIITINLFHCEKDNKSPVANQYQGISEPLDPFEQNELLTRSVNLSALEAPYEGAWGTSLKEEYFRLISEAGFSGVRIPIRWSAHADTKAPYTIKKSLFDRVDWAVDQALSRELAVVSEYTIPKITNGASSCFRH